ncbi:MAG: leucine-rich repeat domain-containing protein [Holosporales bacterium]|nr:leucine-rich repeat domain-containing protein [Holosporales bacterium]
MKKIVPIMCCTVLLNGGFSELNARDFWEKHKVAIGAGVAGIVVCGVLLSGSSEPAVNVPDVIQTGSEANSPVNSLVPEAVLSVPEVNPPVLEAVLSIPEANPLVDTPANTKSLWPLAIGVGAICVICIGSVIGYYIWKKRHRVAPPPIPVPVPAPAPAPIPVPPVPVPPAALADMMSVTTLGNGGDRQIHDFKDLASARAFVRDHRQEVREVTIRSGVIIGRNYFAGLTNLETVTILNTVTTIEERAFEGCSNLRTLTLGQNVHRIGDRAFRGCTSLRAVTIPNSVIAIGDSAFKGCSAMTALILGERLRSIGKSAFFGCTSLPTVMIPDSVTAIGDNAFKNCRTMTVLALGRVQSIGDSAFEGCSNLSHLTLEENLQSIGEGAFRNCTNLQGTIHINGNAVIIPSSVTAIGKQAFEGCATMQAFVSGQRVQSIEESTFKGCLLLRNVGLCKVTHIGAQAFSGCTQLARTALPEVTTIGDQAFAGCTTLSMIVLPKVVTIANRAFDGCSSLWSVKVGPNVQNTNAFDNCAAIQVLSGFYLIWNYASLGNVLQYTKEGSNYGMIYRRPADVAAPEVHVEAPALVRVPALANPLDGMD